MIYYKLHNYNGDQFMITKPVKKKPTRCRKAVIHSDFVLPKRRKRK